jgi:hypothetical protein
MAVQEVVFFMPVAKRFMEEGRTVGFLTFHEAADDILEKESMPYFSLHKMKRSLPGDTRLVDNESIEQMLGIEVPDLILHEQLTANRKNVALLQRKVSVYFTLLERVLNENDISVVVQELGGFIAPQLMYFLCRYRRVHHLFIEPAMFPRRIVFTLNTLYADIEGYQQPAGKTELAEEVSCLVRQYVDKKTVVIPDKDKHFFKDMGIRRLLSPDNFRRLKRKLHHKYVLRREEEYNAIAWYVRYHVIKMFRRKALSPLYSEPAAGERYIYFPFHVPLDVQLTVRCREYLDQERLVKELAGSVPKGYMLYVKEHPAAVGGHPVARLKEILELKNVRLLHPRLNSFDIIRNSACVVTINSKVGFEAIMQQKPVVVLGKSFYKGKGVTIDVNNTSEISYAISQAVSTDIDAQKRVKFLNRAFSWSYPGELYVNTFENLDMFFSSLKLCLIRSNVLNEQRSSEVVHSEI